MRKIELLTGRLGSIAFGIERKKAERKVPEQYEEALKFSVITHRGNRCSFCSFKSRSSSVYVVNICGISGYLFLESIGFIDRLMNPESSGLSLLSVLALLETITECWLYANE